METQLQATILYWEAVMDKNRHMLAPSVEVHIKNTIKYCKQLQQLGGEQNSRGVPTLPPNG